jgi:hypothetical protein
VIVLREVVVRVVRRVRVVVVEDEDEWEGLEVAGVG